MVLYISNYFKHTNTFLKFLLLMGEAGNNKNYPQIILIALKISRFNFNLKLNFNELLKSKIYFKIELNNLT